MGTNFCRGALMNSFVYVKVSKSLKKYYVTILIHATENINMWRGVTNTAARTTAAWDQTMQKVVAIVGNTGVGKSKLAVELAKALNGEIINGDSMQMYRGLDIITNKHPIKERENVPHHLLGHHNWNHQYTVKDFEKEVIPLIDNLHAEGKLPIIVGGTHYYIQSLISDSLLIESSGRELTDDEIKVLEDAHEVEETLRSVDPVILEKFHPNDTRRLRRALEIYYSTGRLPSDIYAEQETAKKLRYDVLIIWIYCAKETLDKRLDDRVDQMVQLGLMDELHEMYTYYKEHSAPLNSSVFQTLGFRQFLPYLETEDENQIEPCKKAMQLQTCQYARKQTKWIKNKFLPYVEEIDGTFAVVDSTDLQHWDENCKVRALDITKKWLNDEKLDSLVPDYIDTARKVQAFGVDQWKRYTCEACSARKGREVTVLGDELWRIHVQSRGHRAATRKKFQKSEG